MAQSQTIDNIRITMDYFIRDHFMATRSTKNVPRLRFLGAKTAAVYDSRLDEIDGERESPCPVHKIMVLEFPEEEEEERQMRFPVSHSVIQWSR